MPGLGLVAALTGAALALSTLWPTVSALTIGVVLGAVVGNFGGVTDRTRPGLTFAAKSILRLGIVLLGLRLSLSQVMALGVPTLLVVLTTVGVTFFGTQWLGRRMGLSRDLSLLVATGYSICGASAIAAVEGATDAEEEEVAMSIGLVTVFGSLAIVVLPALAGLLGLSDQANGIWVGASVHDVAQVVATGAAGGSSVLAVAVVVKLSRVVLLAPIVAGVNLNRRRRILAQSTLPSAVSPDDATTATTAPSPDTAVATASEPGQQLDGLVLNGVRTPAAEDGPASPPPLLPPFVLGFLAMVLLRTTGLVPTGVIDGVKTIEGVALTAALVGLGSGVQIKRLRSLGPKPILLGLVAWVVVAAVSLTSITLLTQ